MNIIQIGCNNCDDHVFEFVSQNKDKITNFLVIDAMPKCVEIAKDKYFFLGEKLIAINCAVGIENRILQFFYPENDETSPHASILSFHVKNHRHPNLKSFYVPCLNINNIVDIFDNGVDRLYVDMEGLDVVTLLSLDYNNCKPKYIEYEFYHSDGSFSSGKNHAQLVDLLRNHGYSIRKSSEYNAVAEYNS